MNRKMENEEKIQLLENEIEQYEILLSLSSEILHISTKSELMLLLKEKVGKLFYFCHSTICLICEDKKHFIPYLLDPESKLRSHADYHQLISQPQPINDGVFDVVVESENPLTIDISARVSSGNAPWYVHLAQEVSIKKMVSTPLITDNVAFGTLTFFSDKEDSFNPNDNNVINAVTSLISGVVANIISNDAIKQRDKENEMLLSVSHAIARIRDKQDLLNTINTILKQVLQFSDIAVSIYNLPQKTYRVFLHDCPTMKLFTNFETVADNEHPLHDGIHNLAIATEEAVILSHQDLLQLNLPHINFMIGTGIKEVACIQLRNGSEIIGGMVLMSVQEKCFSNQKHDLIKRVSLHFATALSNILANEKIALQLKEINIYKEQLELEKAYLKEEFDSTYKHDTILGEGAKMQKVFQLISQVSKSNSSVLLLGETGTGKELIARAIHNTSSRKDKLMIKVNCATLPTNLIESELFGHEKGSFTGAIERKIGKFEMANNGTLFLDEIGEMPLDLQVKLLRALQEKEIERLGGKSTIKTDVRIIAATNRDLQKEVAEGRFRMDLFYRLNVFPIVLPPLRERKEDIPNLALHFLDKYTKNTRQKNFDISGRVMKELINYHWPGNIRELEHLMERSILMTEGNIIKEVHLYNAKEKTINSTKSIQTKTLEEIEKEYIISILNQCKGKVSGHDGAAELLGLNASTLSSKMRKLKITKEVLYGNQ